MKESLPLGSGITHEHGKRTCCSFSCAQLKLFMRKGPWQKFQEGKKKKKKKKKKRQ